jgi:hypothetical protein
MTKTRIALVIFFVVLALLFWSELIFSSLGGLLGDTAGSAAQIGASVAALQIYLVILGLLDLIGGTGALLAIWAYLRPSTFPGRLGFMIAAIGTIIYGLYQLLAGIFFLGAILRLIYIGIGIVYILFGVIAWKAGQNYNRHHLA